MFSGTALSDVGTPDGSMGVSFGDFDLDGRPDLWVANYERELFALYRNLGGGLFQHISQATGIGALGANYVGFGTAFGGWDLDGDEDLVVSNGHVQVIPSNAPVRQRPLLLANQAGQRQVNATAGAGVYFDNSHVGCGIASGDICRDGDLDLISTPTNEPAAVLVNASPRQGRWVQVAMVATQSPRDAIGAQAILETSMGSRVRQVTSGGSYLSQSARTLNWGIPAGAIADWLVIRWPSGPSNALLSARSRPNGLRSDHERHETAISQLVGVLGNLPMAAERMRSPARNFLYWSKRAGPLVRPGISKR
jgi:enediyne biosynthesis protein E4